MQIVSKMLFALTLMSSRTCKLCQQSFSLAKEIYYRDSVAPQVRDALVQVCGGVDRCIQLIDDNLAIFKVYFKHNYPTEPLCELLEVCPSYRVTAQNMCDSCKQISAKLAHFLSYSDKPAYYRYIKEQLCRTMETQNHLLVCSYLAQHERLSELLELNSNVACQITNHCPGNLKMRDGRAFCEFLSRLRQYDVVMDNACKLVEYDSKKQCNSFMTQWKKQIKTQGKKVCKLQPQEEL